MYKLTNPFYINKSIGDHIRTIPEKQLTEVINLYNYLDKLIENKEFDIKIIINIGAGNNILHYFKFFDNIDTKITVVINIDNKELNKDYYELYEFKKPEYTIDLYEPDYYLNLTDENIIYIKNFNTWFPCVNKDIIDKKLYINDKYKIYSTLEDYKFSLDFENVFKKLVNKYKIIIYNYAVFINISNWGNRFEYCKYLLDLYENITLYTWLFSDEYLYKITSKNIRILNTEGFYISYFNKLPIDNVIKIKI